MTGERGFDIVSTDPADDRPDLDSRAGGYGCGGRFKHPGARAYHDPLKDMELLAVILARI